MLLHMPRHGLYSLLISIGGLLFGLDTGCIGSITTMPQFVAFFGPLTATIHGLVVSSILIPAAFASSLAGSLSDYLGRTRTAGIGSLVFGIGAALEASAQSLAMLFIGRIITGIGEGIFMSTITVYVCEISPAKQRGMLCSIQQFFISFGICVGYFVCYGTVKSDSSSSLAWRLPFALQSVIAIAYSAIAFLTLPESPVWLERRNRGTEADLVWDKLGISPREREKTGERSPTASMTIDEAVALAPTPVIVPEKFDKPSALAMFGRPVISRTLLGASLMALQQFSGIDGVLYYAPLLFQAAGLSSSTASFLASGISALLMLLITIPAFILADRWGRRTSILSGGIVIAIAMLLIGTLYAADAVHPDYGAGRWLVITLIFIFALTFSATWAISLRIYASEIQPLATRAPAVSLAQAANWVANWIVAFTTPILLSQATYSPYFLFGGCTVITVMICVLAMPETSGRSLEEIERDYDRGKVDRMLNVTGLTRRLARRRRDTDDSLELHDLASAR